MSEEQQEHLQPNGTVTHLPSPKEGMNRIRVQFCIDYPGHAGKVMDEDGLTEPDMSMTIGQMIQRHANGQTSPAGGTPLYFETQMPTLTDFTDLEHYRDNLEQRLNHVNATITHEKEEAQRRKEEEDAKKAAQAAQNQDDDDPST